MSTKFGLQIDFDLRKTVTSSIRNQTQYWATAAAVLKLYCTWCHYSAAGGQIWRKFCNLMQIELLRYGRSSNRNKNSNMTDVCFSKREIVIIWALLVQCIQTATVSSIPKCSIVWQFILHRGRWVVDSCSYVCLCLFLWAAVSVQCLLTF